MHLAIYHYEIFGGEAPATLTLGAYCDSPNPSKNNDPVPGTFAQISVASASPAPNVAIRIRHGDTVVEVSSDAPNHILSFLKKVIFRAV